MDEGHFLLDPHFGNTGFMVAEPLEPQLCLFSILTFQPIPWVLPLRPFVRVLNMTLH